MTHTIDMQDDTRLGDDTVAPAKPRIDYAAYESDLIELLVQLDVMRCDLEGPKMRRRPAKAIALLQAMLERVVKFSDDHSLYRSPDLKTKSLNFFNLCQTLLTQMQGTGWRGLLGLPSKGPELPDEIQARDYALKQALQIAYEVILANFVLFTDYFGNSKLAREWVEVAAGFLAGFKRSSQEAFANEGT